MTRRTLLIIVLLLVAATAAAAPLQMPGQWDSELQYPREYQASCREKDAEIAKLSELVNLQKQKIALLEEKVRQLESKLQKTKEVTK